MNWYDASVESASYAINDITYTLTLKFWKNVQSFEDKKIVEVVLQSDSTDTHQKSALKVISIAFNAVLDRIHECDVLLFDVPLECENNKEYSQKEKILRYLINEIRKKVNIYDYQVRNWYSQRFVISKEELPEDTLVNLVRSAEL